MRGRRLARTLLSTRAGDGVALSKELVDVDGGQPSRARRAEQGCAVRRTAARENERYASGDGIEVKPVILNPLEYALMNNPFRAAMQRHFEAKRLLDMGGPVAGGTVLEIGCGRGVGVDIILDLFAARHVDTFDLDSRMIARAQDRFHGRTEQVRVWQGDATAIAVEDDHYDAVFDFGIIHHVPQWRSALSEVYRVLKPGGRFYGEEVLARVITHWLWRRLLEHPQADRFSHEQFRAALEEAGFEVVGAVEMRGDFGWYVADKPGEA